MDNMRETKVFIGRDEKRLNDLLDKLEETTGVEFFSSRDFMLSKLRFEDRYSLWMVCDAIGDFWLARTIIDHKEVTPEEFLQLAQEFYPKKTDWSKVPRGTLVLVKDAECEYGSKASFYDYDEDLDAPFIVTEFDLDGSTMVMSYKKAKLIEGDGESE